MIELMNQSGIEGYGRYFILMEICASKLQKNPDEEFTEAHCSFYLHPRLIRERLRVSQTKLESWLDLCQTLALLTWEKVEHEFYLHVPKLLESLDRDTKRARTVRAEVAPKKKIKIKIKKEDKEEDKDINTDKNVVVSPAKTTVIGSSLGAKIFETYSKAFANRYGVEPVRNAKTNSQCAQLAQRLGKDAHEVVKFYLTHNDTWYVKRQHDLGSLLQAAESMHSQWQRGQQVTTLTARNVERTQNAYDAFAHLIPKSEGGTLE
jgi:hypothetical protein